MSENEHNVKGIVRVCTTYDNFDINTGDQYYSIKNVFRINNEGPQYEVFKGKRRVFKAMVALIVTSFIC